MRPLFRRIGAGGQDEGIARYRSKLVATRETEKTALYLTYRSQFNAPDVFNRFFNQVKMPTVQGEHGNYVRAMLAIMPILFNSGGVLQRCPSGERAVPCSPGGEEQQDVGVVNRRPRVEEPEPLARTSRTVLRLVR